MYRILRDNFGHGDQIPASPGPHPHRPAALDEIRHRDNYVYRSLFSTDTPESIGACTALPRRPNTRLGADEYAPLTIGTWQQLDALARTTLPRIGVVRRTAGILSQARRRCRRFRPSGPSTVRRCTTTISAPSARAACTPCWATSDAKGIDFGLRPRHSGLRHGRRRGRNSLGQRLQRRLRQADPAQPPVRLPDALRTPEPDARETRRAGRARPTDRPKVGNTGGVRRAPTCITR